MPMPVMMGAAAAVRTQGVDATAIMTAVVKTMACPVTVAVVAVVAESNVCTDICS